MARRELAGPFTPDQWKDVLAEAFADPPAWNPPLERLIVRTNHGLLGTDEFSEDEAYDTQEALGWSERQLDLFLYGSRDDLVDNEGESEYRDLVDQAIELRERERERGQWRHDESFQTTVVDTVPTTCSWGLASSSRRTSQRRGARRVVRTAHGPPGRPRAPSGDDDPPSPDVVVLCAAVGA